jgi:hypothetical protein
LQLPNIPGAGSVLFQGNGFGPARCSGENLPPSLLFTDYSSVLRRGSDTPSQIDIGSGRKMSPAEFGRPSGGVGANGAPLRWRNDSRFARRAFEHDATDIIAWDHGPAFIAPGHGLPILANVDNQTSTTILWPE